MGKGALKNMLLSKAAVFTARTFKHHNGSSVPSQADNVGVVDANEWIVTGAGPCAQLHLFFATSTALAVTT